MCSKLRCKLQKNLCKNREKEDGAKLYFLGEAESMEPVLETAPAEQKLGSSHLPARLPLQSKLDGAARPYWTSPFAAFIVLFMRGFPSDVKCTC